jgi:hypothetical protein
MRLRNLKSCSEDKSCITSLSKSRKCIRQRRNYGDANCDLAESKGGYRIATIVLSLQILNVNVE